jgi:WD40 repeat protein
MFLANFLGPDDEFVVSGSDCGNVFIWRKDGTLHSILEGDSATVNVIEGHPHLPLFAASGLDTTVKVRGPFPFAIIVSHPLSYLLRSLDPASFREWSGQNVSSRRTPRDNEVLSRYEPNTEGTVLPTHCRLLAAAEGCSRASGRSGFGRPKH